MTQILFAGRGISALPDFKRALEENGGRIMCLDSGQQALDAVQEKNYDLLIADESLGDMTGIVLIGAVISCQPMLNCAAVSSLSPDDFHEVTEGLGVLMQLSTTPGREEADLLMQQFRKIQSFKVGS